jgi:uncharacterized membrane protein YbhN (UPF0104 family)
MRSAIRRWWPALKVLLVLAILVMVGRQFARDLGRPELWQRPLHPQWWLTSAILYLQWQGFSALFWYRLMGHLGARARPATAVRAFYLCQMGKYLPGKAWALFLRTTLVQGTGVRLATAVLATFYEVLTTMAAGVLLGLVLFALLGADGTAPDAPTFWRLLRLDVPDGFVVGRGLAVLLALLLLVPTGLPLLPAVYNRLMYRVTRPFRDKDAAPLPHVRSAYLIEGLALTGLGWLVLGGSLAAGVVGVLGELPASPALFGRLTALMAVSYVAGFVIPSPGGLGVREFFLVLFLTPELASLGGMDAGEARGTAALTVLLLRLVWTAAEVLVAGLLYPIRQGPGVPVAVTVSPGEPKAV